MRTRGGPWSALPTRAPAAKRTLEHDDCGRADVRAVVLRLLPFVHAWLRVPVRAYVGWMVQILGEARPNREPVGFGNGSVMPKPGADVGTV